MFTTEKWSRAELWQEGSKFRRLLASMPGSDDENVSIYSLEVLGLLWCQGDSYNKAEALFECLNPAGQATESISANDKDWNYYIEPMFEIAAN